MKILLVADIESKFIWDHFDESAFRGVELILSAGDLKSVYLSYLVTMIHCPLYYVQGNHDTHYKQIPPDGCDCIDGELVTYKGLRILGLSGSMRYNKHPYESVPPYQLTERQMYWKIKRVLPKVKKMNGFDILLTHSPAFGLGDGKDLPHTGFKTFLPLLDDYHPKYMVFGHMHMQFGKAPRSFLYQTTTMLDAYGYAIIDV